MKLAPIDASGKKLRVGDVVRVLDVPDLDLRTREARRETLPVFKHLVGKYKKIVGFNEYGLAELHFRIAKEPRGTSHSVWIEPHLLRRKNPRAA